MPRLLNSRAIPLARCSAPPAKPSNQGVTMISFLSNIASKEKTGEYELSLTADNSVIRRTVKVFVKAFDYLAIALDFGCIPGTQLHHFQATQAPRLQQKFQG